MSTNIRKVTEKIGGEQVQFYPQTHKDAVIGVNGIEQDIILGGVYDVSAKNSGATFASLSALLSDANLSTLIPTAVRKGGMSIRFVTTSDNKYVEFFLTKDEWSTAESDWEKINLEDEINQLQQQINGQTDIPQPSQSDVIQGKYLYYDGTWRTATSAWYVMIPVASFRGKTLTDTNTLSNDVMYAFIVSYNESGAVFSGSRVSSKFTTAVIPNDANYLYIYWGATPILPTLHIEGSDNGIVGDIKTLQDAVGDLTDSIEDVENEIKDIVADVTTEIETEITENSQNVTSKAGYYVSYTSPFWRESPDYNSFYFIVTENCKIYTDDNHIQFMAIFNNGLVSQENFVLRMVKGGAGGATPIPSKTSKYTLTAGQLILISVYSTGGSINAFSAVLCTEENRKEIGNDIYLGNTQLQQIADTFPSDNMYFQKTATSFDILRKIGTMPYFVKFHYEHRQKTFTSEEYPSFYDNWGLMGSSIVSINNGEITTILTQLYGSEAELAVNVTNPNGGYKYVGGYEHGFDNIITDNNIRQFQLTVDNIVIAEDAICSLKSVGKVVVESKENIYQAYTNTDPFAEVYKKFEFSNDGVFITNKMTLLRNMQFANAQFGMMCLWRRYLGQPTNPYLINKAIKDNLPFTIYTVDDAWKESGSSAGIGTFDHSTTQITEYGELGIGFALKVIDSTLKPNGGMKVWHNAGGFDKIYFDLTGTYSGTQNEELSSIVKWEVYGKPVSIE